MHIYVYIQIYIYIHIHIHIENVPGWTAWKGASLQFWLCIYICHITYIYICIYAYTYKYTYKHIHIHIENVPGWTAWKGAPLKFSDCGSDYAFVLWMLLKVVCEKIMLNLFIGIILDNFSFITDEVSHVEDDKWSGGASSNQILQVLNESCHTY